MIEIGETQGNKNMKKLVGGNLFFFSLFMQKQKGGNKKKNGIEKKSTDPDGTGSRNVA